jgi:hypothetical protein
MDRRRRETTVGVPWQFITLGSLAAIPCGIKGILTRWCGSGDAVQPVARVAEARDDEALLVEV